MGFEELKGFRTLPAVERELLGAATAEVGASTGTTVFAEGTLAEHVWAVKSGLIHIVKHGSQGRQVILDVIPPGELFGAVAALRADPYPASAVAAATSTVWRVPAAVVRDLAMRHPALHAAILQQVVPRLRAAHIRVQSLATERVEQRLARAVLSLAEKLGERRDGATVLHVTRQELADMIGTRVETVIRITSRWQQLEFLRSSRNSLTLHDPAALQQIASED